MIRFFHSKLKLAFNLIHNEKNIKIITTPEKAINLSESFLDLNKKIKERFSEILSERESSFTQNLNQLNQSNNVASVQEKNLSNIPSESVKITGDFNAKDKNKVELLGKKTLRDSPKKISNDKADEILFDKFVNTENPDRGMANRNLEEAGINEYKSKTSANFYLYLNKSNSAKTYLNIKNKKEDEKIQSGIDIRNKIGQYNDEKDKKPFSLKFNPINIVEGNEENLDLNELEGTKDKVLKTANTGNNLHDDEEDEISIPDII